MVKHDGLCITSANAHNWFAYNKNNYEYKLDVIWYICLSSSCSRFLTSASMCNGIWYVSLIDNDSSGTCVLNSFSIEICVKRDTLFKSVNGYTVTYITGCENSLVQKLKQKNWYLNWK